MNKYCVDNVVGSLGFNIYMKRNIIQFRLKTSQKLEKVKRSTMEFFYISFWIWALVHLSFFAAIAEASNSDWSNLF